MSSSEYAFKAVNAPNVSALAVKGADAAVIAVQKRVPVSFTQKSERITKQFSLLGPTRCRRFSHFPQHSYPNHWLCCYWNSP